MTSTIDRLRRVVRENKESRDKYREELSATLGDLLGVAIDGLDEGREEPLQEDGGTDDAGETGGGGVADGSRGGESEEPAS